MKTFEFTIIASGLGLDDAYEDALFEAGCGDATLSFQKGVLIAEFDRASVSFSNAVATACHDIKSAGWKVERIEPDHLVSLSEIAERSKLSRQAISLYVKGERLDGFPAPTAKVTSKHPLDEAIAAVQDNLAFSVKAHIIAALRALPVSDGWEVCLGILAEEIAGIEQSDQEDVKIYLALLYHMQDRMKAALGPLPAPPSE